MLKIFSISWFSYWTLFLSMPFSSIYDAVFEAFFLQFLFFILVFFGYLSVRFGLYFPPRPKLLQVQKIDNANLLFICILFSLIGTALLVFDKIYIQGIDYSRGLAVAREEWRKAGLEREGAASSIFSILGYVFNSGYFIAAILLMLTGQNIKVRYKLIYMVSIFLLLMLNSFISGGRSNVLLLMILVLCLSYSIRDFSFRKVLGKKLWLVLLFTSVFSIFYIGYIFNSRALASEMTPIEYLKSFSPYLGLSIYPWYYNLSLPSFLMEILSLIVLCVAYITHSIATTAALVTNGQGDEVVVFVHILNLMHKVGLVGEVNSNWLLSGRFPSLPGGIYYQFGYLGFFVVSIALGMMSAFSDFLYRYRPSNLIVLFLYLTLFSVLVASPLLLILDFMSYPFIWVLVLMIFCYKGFVGFIKRC